MRHSRALIQVAKAFLDEEEHDAYDLPDKTNVETAVLDKLLPRLAAEGWLTTDDGWVFRLTSTGRRAMTRLLCQRTFVPERIKPEGGTPPVRP